MNIINDNENSNLIKYKLALYECLNLGNGIKDILSIAEQYYEKPIFVCDSTYNITAASSLSKNITYGIKFSKDMVYLDPLEIESMKKYKLIENIYSHSTAFYTTTPDHPSNIWVFCAIRIKNIVVGHIGICYDDSKPTEDELNLATVISKVISIEMQKHDYIVNKTGLQYEYFLTDLLEGKFEDLETLYSKLHVLEKNIYKYISIVAISCDDSKDNALFNKKQMEQLRIVYPNMMSLVYEENIVLLISQDTPIKIIDKKYLELINFLTRNNVKASISQNFTNPLEAGIYYKQASKTLKLGKIHFPLKTVFEASDMTLYNILGNCTINELRSYMLYEVTLLKQYDKDYNTELILTLKSFLNNNRNATKTSEILHIHRSTFFYRIKKIEDLFNLSINDSKAMFLLELSFAIDEYIKNTN